jgi:aerobic carbon-monoxide dehydrogenase medium subunit
VIPNSFDYSAPANLKDALELLANGGKPLSGGMSLIPMMKLRLASPEHVVDVGRVAGLNTIREAAGQLHIGANATHYDVESSALLQGKCPLLAETAAHIGDVQVRNRGTLGGSVAHADPSADYPAALQALEAGITLTSAKGSRTLAAADFFVDTFTTSLEPGELVTEVVVPVEAGLTGTSYQKFLQSASGFAVVGIAARVRCEAGRITFARIGVTGVSGVSYRAVKAEQALEGKAGSEAEIAAAAALVCDGVEASADLHTSAEYRRHLAANYAARAIRAALAKCA